jgi:hypothetical protein
VVLGYFNTARAAVSQQAPRTVPLLPGAGGEGFIFALGVE